jgi:hypothetical protein
LESVVLFDETGYEIGSCNPVIINAMLCLGATVTGIIVLDADDDGLSDGDEAAYGTNPSDPDSDNDGLDDGAEVSLGTNPLDGDTDDDGLWLTVEVALGAIQGRGHDDDPPTTATIGWERIRTT